MNRPEEAFMADVFTVIVLYKTSIWESKTLKSVAHALHQNGYQIKPRTLFYDNSPTPLMNEDIEGLRRNFNLTYIHDETNPGVSKAYNVAANMADKEKKIWLLFFDQDTIVSEDMYRSYFFTGTQKYLDVHLFCPRLKSGDTVYSPCKYYLKRGFFWKGMHIGLNSLKHRSALNSGILIHTNIFHKAGGFNENIKLWFSDFEFIDRFRKLYNQFVIIDAIFIHELSDTVDKDVGKALLRFRHYSSGARESVKTSGDWMALFITVGLRSIKLSIAFKKSDFVRIFLEKFLTSRKDEFAG